MTAAANVRPLTPRLELVDHPDVERAAVCLEVSHVTAARLEALSTADRNRLEEWLEADVELASTLAGAATAAPAA